MATTNLHLVQYKGKAPSVSDLHVGMRVRIPSGASGMVEAILVTLNEEEAIFKSINKAWPIELDVLFNVPDLTEEEFELLPDAVALYGKMSVSQSKYRALVNKAAKLGYVSVQSYTQCSYTDAGVLRVLGLKQVS